MYTIRVLMATMAILFCAVHLVLVHLKVNFLSYPTSTYV